MRGRQVLFEKKFDSIRRRLQKPERPDPCGSPAVLHVPDHLPLQPNRVSHSGQQDEQDQRGLDYGNDDEFEYGQCRLETVSVGNFLIE